MNRELFIQLELFSIPTWNENEGDLFYEICEIITLRNIN